MTYKHLEQGSPEWLEFRMSHIGASDISCIMGTNPWKSAKILWMEKTGRKEQREPTTAMLYGKMNEDLARDKYIKETNNFVIPSVMTSDEWEVAIASLDGISNDGKTICEIKCPLSSKLYDMASKGEIPAYYMDQMQWQLYVSKAESCDFFVFVDGSNFKLINVKNDYERQKKMLEQAKLFWEHVTSDNLFACNSDDFDYIDDEDDNTLAMQYKLWKQFEDDAKEKMEEIKLILKTRHENKKCYFPKAGVKLNWIERKGTINWKKIQEKWNISSEDVELNRNSSSVYPMFSILEE